jgi:alpha-mannosidase
VLRKPGKGDLPVSGGFLSVSTPGVELTAFRKKPEGGYELRVVETEGRRVETGVAVQLPGSRAVLTDLLGNRLSDARLQNGRLAITADPWKILTFHID